MADVLITNDNAGYLSIKGAYDRIAATIQGIVDNYNLLGFGNLAANELATLLQTPIDFIFDKMTGGQPVSIGGLQVDKQKAIEILIKPAGYDTVVNQIMAVKNSGIRDDASSYAVNAATIPGIYTIDNAGHVVVTGSFDTKLQEQNKKYAKTDRAKAMLAFAQNFIDKATELGVVDILKANPNGVGHTVSKIINGGQNNGTSNSTLRLNADVLVQFNNPEYWGR